MFPVLSLLRRGAYNVAYVRPSMLSVGDDGQIRHETTHPVTVFNLASCAWETGKEVRFFTLSARGKTCEETALALARAENVLASKGKLLDRVYTLLLGEEREDLAAGVYTRVIPLAIVKGVHRVVGTATAAPRPRQPARQVFARKMPRGVIVERR